MDSHQRIHIAHPLYWSKRKTETNDTTQNKRPRTSQEEHPVPFVDVVSTETVYNNANMADKVQEKAQWVCNIPDDEKDAIEYLQNLENQNIKHTIWPEQTGLI